MCVRNTSDEVEKMNESGCRECIHYDECVRDVTEGGTFSDSRLGKKCSGYKNDKGETGFTPDLFPEE